ncbi:hypothetical protein FHG87_003803 [Trinorchestia longiramus]|nr:hypothetical protein FHG87_003803 [Trinorchestia longiramus]
MKVVMKTEMKVVMKTEMKVVMKKLRAGPPGVVLPPKSYGVENEPIVLELSASGEHQEANLEFTESCHPDQSLNVELQGGSSSNGSDCSPSTSSLYSISSLDLGYSSELNNSCSIESSSSSFEFCESDCVVKKCKVACSSVKDSSSPGDLDTFAETSSSEKMVAPLALAKTSTLVEVPKLKTGVGYHVAPACGKGKTIHAFGPCSPLSCKSKKSAPKLKKLQPLEEIKMATSNVPNTTSRSPESRVSGRTVVHCIQGTTRREAACNNSCCSAAGRKLLLAGAAEAPNTLRLIRLWCGATQVVVEGSIANEQVRQWVNFLAGLAASFPPPLAQLPGASLLSCLPRWSPEFDASLQYYTVTS